MGKTVIVALLLAVGVYLAIDAFIKTDAERVEEEVERLVGVARGGGEAAAAEIRAAIAEDYRGTGFFSRERVAGYIETFLVLDPAQEITTGGITAVPIGDEILVPLLRIHVRTARFEGDVLLRVTFAERGDHFRVVNVEQWRLER